MSEKLELLHTDRVLIVEGKYDAARLSHLTDAMILLTDGFGIYKDKKRQQLFKQLAHKNGLTTSISRILSATAFMTSAQRSGYCCRYAIWQYALEWRPEDSRKWPSRNASQLFRISSASLMIFFPLYTLLFSFMRYCTTHFVKTQIYS